jgi:PAS domain S-box-containing protein
MDPSQIDPTILFQNKFDILVVDDTNQNLWLLNKILTHCGYTVRMAQNGCEALKSAQEKQPDLILMDVRMPEMDGFEACRQLKADERTRKIPVIFISALEDPKDKVAAFDAGGVDYVTKPFEAAEVLSRVNTHLNLSNLQKQLELRVTQRTEQLEKSNRSLRLLSQINQLLVRAEKEDEFLQGVCKAVVDIGQFPICCLHIPHHKDRRSQTIVQYTSAWPDPSLGQWFNSTSEIWPLFQAFTTGQILVIQDLVLEANQTPWHRAALEMGLRALLCLPLHQGDTLFGIVGILSNQPEVFTKDEIQLLKEMADDLAFGVTILEDRIQRRQAELALIESEIRYRMLFEKAGDAILMLSVDEPDAGRIVQANQAAATMHGYGVEELIGLPIAKLDSPEDAQKSPGKFQRIVAGEWLHDEIVHVRKDGSSFPCEISAGLIQIGDQRLVLSFIRDITQRKKMETDKKALEDQIRQANKMEAIGTLASGIAHDFNNILFAISGFTELSIQFTPDDSIVKQNLIKIQRANRRAAELVSQILTLSRKKERSVQALQPKLIVKEALKLLRATLPSTIDIRTEIGSEAYIQADATQIHQIIMNLCVNANHAMEESGGVLTIRLVDRIIDASTAMKTVDLEPGPYIELSVGDTGTGISEEIIDRVFDPYFTTKPQEKGTGLGLSVVHGIVKSYLGKISIQSKPNQGCKVTVLLPTITSHQKEEVKDESPLPKGHETVLFVDDEDILIDIGRQMLEILGYKVTTRNNGHAALTLFKENPKAFDLVITDFTMPKMTGPQLARAILEIVPDQPIVIVSGMEAPLTNEEARQLGIKSFIRKPVVLKEIASAVRKALD